MPKITSATLRQIINEEIKRLQEGAREDQAATMAVAASKLLKAIESFKDVASAKVKSTLDSSGDSLEVNLREIEKLLKRIVSSPMEHVDGPKQPAPPPVTSDSADSVKKVSVQPKIQKK